MLCLLAINSKSIPKQESQLASCRTVFPHCFLPFLICDIFWCIISGVLRYLVSYLWCFAVYSCFLFVLSCAILLCLVVSCCVFFVVSCGFMLFLICVSCCMLFVECCGFLLFLSCVFFLVVSTCFLICNVFFLCLCLLCFKNSGLKMYNFSPFSVFLRTR